MWGHTCRSICGFQSESNIKTCTPDPSTSQFCSIPQNCFDHEGISGSACCFQPASTMMACQAAIAELTPGTNKKSISG